MARIINGGGIAYESHWRQLFHPRHHRPNNSPFPVRVWEWPFVHTFKRQRTISVFPESCQFYPSWASKLPSRSCGSNNTKITWSMDEAYGVAQEINKLLPDCVHDLLEKPFKGKVVSLLSGQNSTIPTATDVRNNFPFLKPFCARSINVLLYRWADFAVNVFWKMPNHIVWHLLILAA